MRLGFATIFSFRPHVEHMQYLASQLEQAGHEIFFLNCFGTLPNCYNLAFKKRPKLLECAKCISGSMWSYRNHNMFPIDSRLVGHNLTDERLAELAVSSAVTLTRIEDPKDLTSPALEKLRESLKDTVQVMFSNSLEWIRKERLEGVFVFNGRMESVRAVLEACKESDVPFVSVERTLLGDGLQLIPGQNCLSLMELDRLTRHYSEAPLTRNQALRAASLVCKRFLRTNDLEWRTYNRGMQATPWPTTGSGKRALILPSSKNENMTHPEWASPWVDFPSAFSNILERLKIGKDSVVVRGHPGWAQQIWNASGEKIEKLYSEWCKKEGLTYFPGNSLIDTSSLMSHADVVILNGSSAAYEAIALGKKVISLGPSQFQSAGCAEVLRTQSDLENLSWSTFDLDSVEAIRKMLRFLYVYGFRFAIFNSSIIAKTTKQYRYADSIDTDRLLEILLGQQVLADDQAVGTSLTEESEVIKMLLERRFGEIIAQNETLATHHKSRRVRRRHLFRVVDFVRNRTAL